MSTASGRGLRAPRPATAVGFVLAYRQIARVAFWPVATLVFAVFAFESVYLYAEPPIHPVKPYADSLVYLAAGERLNAGHLLYAFSPGDRVPTPGPIAILSPPFAAAIWRPLALVGTAVLPLWGLACIASATASLGLVLSSRRLEVAFVMLLLTPSVTDATVVGNLDVFVLLAAVLLWRTRHPGVAFALGLLTAAKLAPALLLLWLLTQRDWRGLGWGIAGIATGLLLGLLGAGWDAQFTYLDIARATPAFGPSLAYVDPRLPLLALVAGSLGVVALRRAGLSYGMALLTMTLGSPVVHLTTLGAALAPMRSGAAARGQRRSNESGERPLEL